MCEKCDRSAAELAPTLVDCVRMGLEMVMKQIGHSQVVTPQDQMLLLLVHMVVHQARQMGVEPGPVLLRAGGAVVAEVPVSRALAVKTSPAPPPWAASTTTH